MRSKLRRGSPLVALVVSVLTLGGYAHAETTAEDKALATTLFREGRALLQGGSVADACLKLEESHRLDPSGGTILNLALCHEQEGKLARSWSEFNEAAAFARRDLRADRESEAQERARRLEPRLSRLTVVVPAPARVDKLRVECDGRELTRASWSLAMPVDGGDHVVRATAPRYLAWTTTISLPAEGGTATVAIPPFLPAPAPSAPAAVNPAVSLAAREPTASDRGIRRKAAWLVGGAAIVQLFAAAYYGLEAFDLKSEGAARLDDARHAADVSTVLTVTTLLTGAGAAYLFLHH